MPSFHEILIVVLVIILVFSVPKLPQLGDALGRSIRNFKRGLRGDNEIDVTPRDPNKEIPPPKDSP